MSILITFLCWNGYAYLKRGIRTVTFMKRGTVEGLNVYLNYISLLGCVHLSSKRNKTSYIYERGHSRMT